MFKDCSGCGHRGSFTGSVDMRAKQQRRKVLNLPGFISWTAITAAACTEICRRYGRSVPLKSI